MSRCNTACCYCNFCPGNSNLVLLLDGTNQRLAVGLRCLPGRTSVVNQIRVAPLAFSHPFRSIYYEQLYTEFNVGAARQICLESEIRSRAEHELELKEKLKGKYDARGRLLEEKDLEILRLKSLLWRIGEGGRPRSCPSSCQVSAFETVSVPSA
ncbi:hypothetical protein Tco_1125732 [Tanacetum coccineum]